MRNQILDEYWIEFLNYVKGHNDEPSNFKRDPSILNFWYWYMEHKLND